MGRIRRLESARFVGARDTMRVYDCDNPAQLAALEARMAEKDLVNLKLVQTFAPDTVDEARNRGFKPA